MRSSCEHPAEATYWDGDEEKCRACGQSLTYPPRHPTAEDEKDRRRDARITAGEHRRRDESPVEVVEASPSAPLLLCYCCREMLPPENFYTNNSRTARNRGYRAWRCRPCAAFQLRVRRELNPEGTRQKDRARREQYVGALNPILREQERQRRGAAENTAGNALAQVRSRARQSGRPVPLQRAGRSPLWVKQICRISEGCPLRPFCSTEAKGLG